MSGCQTHDDDHRALLRSKGLRVTAARVAILDVLCHARTAVDAQEVVDRLAACPDPLQTDRVTVYRSLNSFVDAGIAHRIDPGDRVFRFALAGSHEMHTPAARPEDHDGADSEAESSALSLPSHEHPHFVCDSCGGVSCLPDTEVSLTHKPGAPGDEPLPKIDQRTTVLHGTCAECAPGSQRGRRSSRSDD